MLSFSSVSFYFIFVSFRSLANVLCMLFKMRNENKHNAKTQFKRWNFSFYVRYAQGTNNGPVVIVSKHTIIIIIILFAEFFSVGLKQWRQIGEQRTALLYHVLWIFPVFFLVSTQFIKIKFACHAYDVPCWTYGKYSSNSMDCFTISKWKA